MFHFPSLRKYFMFWMMVQTYQNVRKMQFWNQNISCVWQYSVHGADSLNRKYYGSLQPGHGTRDVKHYGSWCFKNTNCQWMSGLPLTSSPPPSIHHQMMPPLQHSEQYICNNIYVLDNSRWHGNFSTQDRSSYLI